MQGSLRRGRLLLVAMILGGVLSGSALAQAQGRDADVRQKIESTQEPQTQVLTGTFNIVWGHPEPGSHAEPQPQFFLDDGQGQPTELSLDRDDAKLFGGPQAFNGEEVAVEGKPVTDDPNEVEVRSISFQDFAETKEALAKTETGEPAAEPLVSGSKPWVTVGCRFADSTTVTPRDEAYFNGLLGTAQPGIDHFWQQLSYNSVNLSGSQVSVWHNLPRARADYFTDPLRPNTINLSLLAEDCTAAADASVNYPDFSGINLVFNDRLDCCAWGGGRTLTRDGVTKGYSMTWMPPWGYNDQFILGHEMGHGFGLPHSSGAYNTAYDSDWDPMSSGGACSPAHATYGCLGDHTVSYHKDLLGWIPSGRKYLAAANTGNQSVTLERLGVLPSSGYLEAQIPIPGTTTQFYTVEARRLVDAGNYENAGPIPGEAVVIHKVDTTLWDRNAQVVDPDNNGNPNDSASMWTVGETFTDTANGISVQVTGATATGFNVNISTGSGGGDTTPPGGVSLTSHANGQVVRFGETLTATATDNVGVQRVEFLVNGSVGGRIDASAPYAASWNSQTIPDGYAVLAARAFDAAGNRATSLGKVVVVDNTNPRTTITSGPPAKTRKTTATFTFVSSEANSTFRCSLDGGAYTRCSSPKTYVVGRRSHTFRVYAVGAGGAVNDRDTTPAVRTWKVLRKR